MIAAALLLIASSTGYDLEPGERLVIVGRDGPELDACAGYGEVGGLSPTGDGFLSVRIAPGTDAREKDRLSNGSGLALCDEEGDWFGVVYYKPGDEPVECATGTPSPYIGGYRGPCRYGWVHKRFVKFLAG